MRRKLLEDIKNSPSRFYRFPGDVIRDRRFRDEERLEILDAWENVAADEADDVKEPSVRSQVTAAKKELQRRDAASQR